MGPELLSLGIVTISLLSFIVLPFIPISYFLCRTQGWPKILLSAIVMGCSIQASLGLLSSHVFRFLKWPPQSEIVVLVLVWMVLLWWSSRRARVQSEISYGSSDSENHLPLIFILVISFILRSIHPIEVSYLGQSDAYTHLNYVHNILKHGYLMNPVYPPGFHWLLARPAMIFSIDPYLMARFAGAFFGTSMVLGVYVLLGQSVGRRTAVFGSFCAAAFPGMTLLMKTGVGVFANQLGILLLPAIFLFYINTAIKNTRKTSDPALLLIGLCGMASAVPMMMIHVFLIFGLERLSAIIKNHRGWIKKTLQLILLTLPAICLLAFHLSQVGPGQRYETATILTSYSEKKPVIVEEIGDRIEEKLLQGDPITRKISTLVKESPYFRLLFDFTSVKRRGYGNGWIDILAVVLAANFIILLSYGVLHNNTPFKVIGVWGLLTSVQAGTGFLQFSSYQREGWSLLIATCCLCGILAARIYQIGKSYRIFRFGVYGVIAGSVVLSGMYPPMHPALKSSAENEIVSAIRFLGRDVSEFPIECRKQDKALCTIANHLIGGVPLIIVTRRFTGWGNQGEITSNVLQPLSPARTQAVDNRKEKDIFQPGYQYVVLVDRKNKLSGQQLISGFAMVTPSMVRKTMSSQRQLFRLNENILNKIIDLSETQWNLKEISLTDNLTAFVVIPSGSK